LRRRRLVHGFGSGRSARGRGRSSLVGRVGSRLVVRTFVLLRDHELLLADPFLQALEVAADRCAHVLEVAFLAHEKSFPTNPASPSSGSYRGEPKVAVQTT
jgi:hypothetical protein